MSINHINNFVKAFLQENSDEEVLNLWNTPENQALFKKSASKGKKKSGPKRPKTAYIYFCNYERKRITEQIESGKLKKEDYDYTKIMKHCGDAWKLLKVSSEDEIARFQKMADDDRERYNQEFESYVPEEGDEILKKTKKKKNTNGIKSSKSAYMYFCDENRSKVKAEMEDLDNKEIVAELGRRWTKSKETPAKTKKYFDLATKDKLRHEKEKASLVLSQEDVDEVEDAPVPKKKQTKPTVVNVDTESVNKPVVKKPVTKKK